jgi:hypothetical protein
MAFLGRARWLSCALLLPGCASGPRPELHRDDAAGRVTVAAEGREIVSWQFGTASTMPHWFPLKSPSGKDLLIQHPDPYPHHRAMWIADKVQLGDGPVVDFYHGLPREAMPCIRHVETGTPEVPFGACAAVGARLQWIANGAPVLDDERLMVLVPLADGEALIDLAWTLRAAHGPVTFHSDWIHYAWPYLRVHPQFSAESGGTLVDDQGRTGQGGTNGRYANWIDCSNTVDGVTEGVAVFVPQDGQWRKWLTRDYGCFGPRRDDAQSGVKFTLEKGEELSGRVRIFVHRGDAVTGRVAERYREYVDAEPR